MVRLQQVVSGVLQRSSEVSACQARAAAQWSQLTASGEPGKYLIRAGEAVTEVTCKEVVVEVRPTVKCFDKLPIMTFHDTDFKYLDLAQYTLTQHASGRSCSPTTALFFRGLGGNWFRIWGRLRLFLNLHETECIWPELTTIWIDTWLCTRRRSWTGF